MKRKIIVIGIIIFVVFVAAFYIVGTNFVPKAKWYIVSENFIYPGNIQIGVRTLVTMEFACENKYFQVVVANNIPTMHELGCDQKVSNMKIYVYDLLQSPYTAEQRLKLLQKAEERLNFNRLGQFPGQRVYGTVGITSPAWPEIRLK